MHQMAYYHLILRYPGLRRFVNQCHVRNEYDKLWDFMLAIETTESIHGET